MSLLRAIATQQLDEAGFKDFVNKLRPGAKPAQTEQKPETHNTTGSDTDPAMKRIASQLSDSGDSIKLAIGISRAGLVNQYLKKGGEVETANDTALIDDGKLQQIAKDAASARNVHDYTTWPSSHEERVMLFSVPKNVIQNFISKKTREALAMVISHKFYQMTLMTNKAQQLFSTIEKVAQAKGENPMSFDVLEETFNPYVIENHPAGILKAARQEWDAAQAQKKAAPGQAADAELDDKQAEAKRIARAREIEKMKSGDEESESLESAVLNQYLLNVSKSPEDIAATMTQHFAKVQDLNMVQKMVQQLGEKYPDTKLKDVAISFRKPEDNTGDSTEA